MFNELPDEQFDNPMGESTGAAVIFGATGGVMEAALRTAVETLTGEELKNVEFQEVRGTGLMLAVEFHTCELGYETSKGLFARRVMTAGTLVNAKTIRFEPTAVISDQDIKDVISRFDEALADVKAGLAK